MARHSEKVSISLKGMFSTLRMKLLDHRNMPQVAGHIKMSLASSGTLLPLQCTTSQLKLSPTRGRLLNREQGNHRLASRQQGQWSIVRGTQWRIYDRRSGAPPVKLSLGREGLAVVFDVCLGRFRSVVHCMLLVSAS